MGRRSYDLCEGAGGWGDGGPLGQVPCFVLSHGVPERVAAPSVFTFAADGIENAIERAKAAAGDKYVGLHGATTAQQCLRAGLLDEMQIDLVPILLGGGIRLFDHLGMKIELERTRVIESPGVIHLRFRVLK
jgi:dihydrofolate reductase